MSRVQCLVAAAVAVLVAVGSVDAETLRVPEDYGTIQAAIDAAAVGDSVLVGPGTWYGTTRSLQVCANFLNKYSVLFLRPGVSVISTAGPDVTILDGGPQVGASVETVFLSSVNGPPILVQGFTITGDWEGVSIGCTDSHVQIVDCHIVNNGATAVDVSEAKVTLVGCLVSGNQGTTSFGAVNVMFDAQPINQARTTMVAVGS